MTAGFENAIAWGSGMDDSRNVNLSIAVNRSHSMKPICQIVLLCLLHWSAGPVYGKEKFVVDYHEQTRVLSAPPKQPDRKHVLRSSDFPPAKNARALQIANAILDDS
jgi:hypothetical protein